MPAHRRIRPLLHAGALPPAFAQANREAPFITSPDKVTLDQGFDAKLIRRNRGHGDGQAA